jgi:hypothetical protein
MTIQFTSSDVWLLLSIALAQGDSEARLANILAAGDLINKAMFTPEGLRRGFSKLTQTGYVLENGGVYSLTEGGRMLVEEARHDDGRWLRMWEFVERRLSATRGPEDAPHYEDCRFTYPSLTDEAVAAADHEYRARLEKWFAELKAKES